MGRECSYYLITFLKQVKSLLEVVLCDKSTDSKHGLRKMVLQNKALKGSWFCLGLDLYRPPILTGFSLPQGMHILPDDFFTPPPTMFIFSRSHKQ